MRSEVRVGATARCLPARAAFFLAFRLRDCPPNRRCCGTQPQRPGLARLTQLVLPTMRAQRSGRIVNVSSVGGKVYSPLGGWYHAMRLGARTLQRRIVEEGTTFRQLVHDVRRELVRQYLDDPAVGIAEAAFPLGYDDPNSFYRAFRRWEGTTPAHWRAQRRTPAAH